MGLKLSKNQPFNYKKNKKFKKISYPLLDNTIFVRQEKIFFLRPSNS